MFYNVLINHVTNFHFSFEQRYDALRATNRSDATCKISHELYTFIKAKPNLRQQATLTDGLSFDNTVVA